MSPADYFCGCGRIFKSGEKKRVDECHKYESTLSVRNGEMSERGPAKFCQLFGVLWKKHSSQQSSGNVSGGGGSQKWAKRFFVLRDSFLLYYIENEQKEFGIKCHANVHPKGFFPLGNADIQPSNELGHLFVIRITSEELLNPLVIAAENEYDRDRWVSALRQASRITWSNAQLGDNLIRQLENHGLQMAEDKQTYFDKLQHEAEALSDEKEKSESLERLNYELEKEKLKMEQLANDMKEEYEKMKLELNDTLEAMSSVEENKQSLTGTIEQLQRALQDLEKTRHDTMSRMKRKQRPDLRVLISPASSDEGVGDLTKSPSPNDGSSDVLREIEEKITCLMESKADVEKQLKENEEKGKLLEAEKRAISDHAEELHVSLRDLASQKAITENELKEEVMARLTAEKRLQVAEQTLSRLESGLNRPDQEFEETRQEMIGDVKSLKKFFENLEEEARVDANKSVMYKNAVHARKAGARRAQTLKYQTLRKQRVKAVDAVVTESDA